MQIFTYKNDVLTMKQIKWWRIQECVDHNETNKMIVVMMFDAVEREKREFENENNNKAKDKWKNNKWKNKRMTISSNK